jgi:hypothetical protein
VWAAARPHLEECPANRDLHREKWSKLTWDSGLPMGRPRGLRLPPTCLHGQKKSFMSLWKRGLVKCPTIDGRMVGKTTIGRTCETYDVQLAREVDLMPFFF